MKEALEHSKITFENMLKQWQNLSDKQRKEIQSNIDYLNEQLTIPAVVGRSEQFYCTCSRAKGLDHDEEGMPYCIECQKPVQ